MFKTIVIFAVRVLLQLYKKIFILYLNQNICCGYSKEPSQRDGYIELPKYMFKLMSMEINTILPSTFYLTEPMTKLIASCL